jgi:hypothetical protein
MPAFTINGDGRREHKALDAGVDGFIDEVDAADHIIHVVVALDEVAQPFGRVGCQMVHIVELLFLEQCCQRCMVEDGSLHKADALRHILCKTTAEVIQPYHIMALGHQTLGQM